MGTSSEEKPGLKPIKKPLAVRSSDTRRTHHYKEQLKLKSKRSRLLIMAIDSKLTEKENEIVKIKQESDLKLSTIWQQLLLLQGNLNKEQVRLGQVLQDKENIIQSQRQEIQRLRLLSQENSEKQSSSSRSNNNGSFRRQKRERSAVIPSSSTDDSSSSPGSTPKQRQLVRTVSNDNYKEDSSLASQDAKNVNLSRQNKFIKGCERPKLKQTNSNSSISEEVKTPKGILKPALTPPGVKPPVPSRTKINEILRGGSTSSDECLGGRISKNNQTNSTKSLGGGDTPQESTESTKGGRYSLNRDSGNSSLDSSDPSSSIEWKLSVRSTLPNISNKQQQQKLPGPRQEKRVKPPPPPRRSKSYERPSSNNNNNHSTLNNNNNPDIQSNYEEYDLNNMMETNTKTAGGIKNGKKVSFKEQGSPGNLRKMPSSPNLTGEMPSQPQTLARTLFFPGNPGQPTFSSFKTESKPGLESSVIHSLDSSSVLSHLLKDSLMTKLEPGVSEGPPSQPAVDENLNICKYYF